MDNVEGSQGEVSLTPEQISAIIKERDEAKQLAEKSKADLLGVVDELKEVRRKKQEAEDAARAAQPVDEVEKKIAEALQAKDAADAKRMREEAKEEFLSRHKEFSDENDPTGIRRQALDEKLARFNLSSISNRKDVLDILEDARRLLITDDRSGSSGSPYASTPQGGAMPVTGHDSSLSAKEREVMARNGWDSKKYLSLKSKHPEFIEQLMSF